MNQDGIGRAPLLSPPPKSNAGQRHQRSLGLGGSESEMVAFPECHVLDCTVVRHLGNFRCSPRRMAMDSSSDMPEVRGKGLGRDRGVPVEAFETRLGV
jgi:hypothetical protein